MKAQALDRTPDILIPAQRASRIGRLLGPLSLALLLAAFNIGCVGVTASKSTNTTTGALQINTPALPNAITQTAYTGALSATGGTTPYTWSIASGSLPPGLNLNSSSGAITGTPTTAGTFTFTAEAKDSSPTPQTATASASVLTVELLQITTTSLPDPQVQTSYSATLTVSGGMAPDVWSISSGSLPPGLSLDSSSGVISGIPTSTGSYAFTVEVSDPPSVPQKSTKNLNTKVQPRNLQVTTNGLSSGQVQAAYSATLAATGGTTPYSWSISAGALPAGLSLNSSTGAISGTPTQSGTFSFTAQVTDSVSHTAQQALSIIVSVAAVAPSITTQPVSGTVIAGQTATFSVTASGTSPLNYQWNKNSAAVSGATAASYTTPATTTADNGAQFTVTISNSAGTVTSNAATLTVNTPPSITTQPVSQTVTAGQTASFSVTASGTSSLSYQWNKNGTAISGATSSSYTTPAETTADNGAQFTVVVSNSAGSVSSNAATLTVNATPIAPSITTQPVSQTVIAGQTVAFSVAATGTAPLSYQWRKNGTAINGASSASYATPATTTADNGAQFTAVVSNSVGNVTSNVATLTVNAATYLLGTSPTSLSFGNVNTVSSSLLTVTLTSSGNSNVTISSVSVSGAGFNASGVSAGLIMTPGQTATLSVTFAPAATGSVTGSVTVFSNASNSPATIALSGTGVATTPPTVAITSPANGATVSGTITVSGTASDIVGVSAVQVQVDAGAFSPASGTTSWTFSLNTGSLSNAAHTLTARATDTSGNSATTAVTVNVSNSGSIINVLNYGATGNGTTNDTAAINSAISALASGDTLLFPCGTYITTSQLTINMSNITIDGSSCAVIKNTAGSTTLIAIGGSGSGNPNYGAAVALSATANELSTSFTTVSSLGVNPGDYVRLQEGGEDSSGGSGNTGCDPSGCRGELLKVASVSGNTITVTTALHDTFNPSVNAATAQKILSPVTGVTVRNVTFDGSGSDVYGLAIAGVAESTVSGVTSRNVQGAALLNRGDFNVAWSNITVSGAGSAQCGDAVWFENQGNLSVNGLSVSSENPGASGTGCLYNGAFGFGMIGSANGTLTNVTVDAAGAYGRPFKTTSTRWTTFNSLTVKNGVQNYNGISLEYYSSHNTYNNCVVTNNGAGTGTGSGNAGINTFGNFNQYNNFNNCTVSGNGNVQVLINSYDALRLGQDSNNTFNGGAYAGTNNVESVIEVEGANVYIHNAIINGSGSTGIGFNSYGTDGCINNNTFTSGTGLGGAINSSSSSTIGSGNILNGLSSNLTAGTCGTALGVAVSISPTAASVASAGTQQFTATVTGSTNIAVTWSASAGSISSSGLFTAPAVSANTTVTVSATSQADTSQAASASVIVTPSAPPNTFGYAVQGATVGTTMSNSVSATRYQMAGQNGTVTSMSVFIASPVSASPNNQFQVAIYADNNGTPGALIASSVSQTIVPDAWNTVPISAPVAANAYYWFAYNTNGLAANANNLRYDAGGATSMWITSEPFGAWPATYGPIAGTSSYSASIYATFQ